MVEFINGSKTTTIIFILPALTNQNDFYQKY